ncbi:hypothetical protein CHS0354_009967 [Potamilus streckersoni]|uniref:PEHE domain-containing protein n=1 Tax=Potamilus streckersoni TaxID=2493646 RepID=A0AAE0TCV5_9BIVA|nr:hypothetical protein CHS0354_009967 [Potamilus streckersoni]
MNRHKMKSDVLFESRTRSDGRQNLRQRVTKINGEYDPDLALAIQESLKQAEMDARAKENKTVNSADSIEDMSVSKPIMKSSKQCGDQKEINHLKDLLLLHIDLIQQQQELLTQKEKQIDTLKSEKNALQCRLERMERRLSLLRQKEGTPESPGLSSFVSQSSPRKEHSTSVATSDGPCVTATASSEWIDGAQEKSKEKPIKRKLSLEFQRVRKKFGADFPLTAESPTEEDTEKACRALAEKARQKAVCKKPRNNADAGQKELRTDKLYHVSFYEPISREIEIEDRPDVIKGAAAQLEVEVPSWRIQTFTNLYVLEGTENLEDDIFVKRHQKPEIEEKRRKRWDMQRIREQKMYEKLKEKENDAEKNKELPVVESFYPTLDSIKYIEVDERISVTAFGHSIPLIHTEDFALPWETSQPRRARNK